MQVERHACVFLDTLRPSPGLFWFFLTRPQVPSVRFPGRVPLTPWEPVGPDTILRFCLQQGFMHTYECMNVCEYMNMNLYMSVYMRVCESGYVCVCRGRKAQSRVYPVCREVEILLPSDCPHR